MNRKLLQHRLMPPRHLLLRRDLRDKVCLEHVGADAQVRLVHGDPAGPPAGLGRVLPRRQDLPVAEDPQLVVPARGLERVRQLRVDVDGGAGGRAEPEVVRDGLVAGVGGRLDGVAEVLGGALSVGVGDDVEAGEACVGETFFSFVSFCSSLFGMRGEEGSTYSCPRVARGTPRWGSAAGAGAAREQAQRPAAS